MGGIAKKQKRNGSNGRFVLCAALALSDTNNVGDMTVVTAQSTLQNIPARSGGLDQRTKAKIARAERDFYAERQRNSILVARVKSLETDLYVANKKIADAEEQARVNREAVNRKIRLARQAALIAKTTAAKKAAAVAERIRSKAAMVLETTRKEHHVAVAREIQERECRLQRALECNQEQMLYKWSGTRSKFWQTEAATSTPCKWSKD